MYDVPMISTNCRSPRSRTPRPCQTFLEDNTSNNKNSVYSQFELKSESDFDEYDQMLSDNSFTANSKVNDIGNVQATHSNSYTNTSISRPIMIPEPVVNTNVRSFFQPQILAQSPKSNNFLNSNNDDDGDFEFYPDEDEFYPTDSFVANTKNNENSLFCFSEDDDDFDKRNGIDIKKPVFIKDIPIEKENPNKDSKSKYIVNRKDGTNLNSSFDEFDIKCKNSPEINKSSVKLMNSKFFNFEFDDNGDDNTNNTNDKEKNSNVGLSTKFSQTRLLKFSNQSKCPISLEPTNINQLNNETEGATSDLDHENKNASPWNEIPKPFLPTSVSPSNFLLEFQKHEAEENLRKTRIEWDERIEKERKLSRTKFAELNEKQKLESAPFGSRKSSKNSTSPQRLELISKSSGPEQPVFRVRTVPSASITKAISDYDKFSKENNLDNAPINFESNEDYEYTNYDTQNGSLFSPTSNKYLNPKPKSAIPSANSISSPRTIQTPRPMPMTPNPTSGSKDPKRRTIFKATSDIPGIANYKKRTNGTLIPTTTTTTTTNYNYVSMMSNEDMKREKKLLEDRHKQEVLALNAECTASIKALEDKRNADIARKESQLNSIIEKIELQKKREELENRLKNDTNDFDIRIKNKNSQTPDSFRNGRIDFNRTGRLNRKQQTIDELQRQMMPYEDKD